MTKAETKKLERKAARAKRFAEEITDAAAKFGEYVEKAPGTKRAVNAEARLEKIRQKYEGVFDVPVEG